MTNVIRKQTLKKPTQNDMHRYSEAIAKVSERLFNITLKNIHKIYFTDPYGTLLLAEKYKNLTQTFKTGSHHFYYGPLENIPYGYNKEDTRKIHDKLEKLLLNEGYQEEFIADLIGIDSDE